MKGATRLSDESIKVTDKRMFTPDGELREEYRFLEERAKEAPAGSGAEATPGAEAASGPAPSPGPAAGGMIETEGGPGAGSAAAPDTGSAADRPVDDFPDAEGESPGFFDLLGVLAEPVPFYLGDAALPTGERQENLEAARFYIDLLDTLRRKTGGNLTAQEADALEDVLYRLRVRYVQKRR